MQLCFQASHCLLADDWLISDAMRCMSTRQLLGYLRCRFRCRFRPAVDISSMYLHIIYTDDKGSCPKDVGNLWDLRIWPKESHAAFVFIWGSLSISHGFPDHPKQRNTSTVMTTHHQAFSLPCRYERFTHHSVGFTVPKFISVPRIIGQLN